ncbi:MAG: patatin-like phospholipase family protein [Gammaproteobacteria bacterium]|nr:patatin-like phospholipase family protein [Gammaproteobacteria bacterium]MDH5302540.1 patatin-like phospholipase family protein [Gammaproteobacteria bacterium]MDH5321912.1 patatin-like phospholipase family protein [Gammaproteobacteria bacterium]
MSKRMRKCLLAALLALAALPAVAATETEVAAHTGQIGRPRIGLVLGGGGARGAAHIGVLQELERLRVPIDAIAGTSMGAIVGGLYASGMSADELEELVNSLEWARVLSDTPKRSDLNFRRKQDDIQYPVEIELGLREGGLVLPMGVVQGQNLDLLLRDLTADVAHIRDYNQLPIPFRAIASNIETGDAHIMASGDLAASIRASMSVPGLIAPAKLDGTLLVDGGIVANLPIDVIRTMDVDIIIAVDVEFPLYSPQELESAAAITEQMLTILTRKETIRQIATLQSDDVLIRPQLGTLSSSDFAAAAEAIAKGVDAATQSAARLSELAIDEQAFAAHLASRTRTTRTATTLAFVRINHDSRIATPLLASRLGIFAGDEIDQQVLAAGAGRVYALDLYQRVGYELVEENGATGVVYTAVAKSWGSDFLNFGVSIEGDFDGSTEFNLFGRLTRTGLNSRGAEWRTDFRFGSDLSLFSEYYQPFGAGLSYFFAPFVNLQQRNQNVFVDSQATAQLRVASGEYGVDFGRELGSVGEIRTGMYSGRGESRIKLGDPSIPDNEFDIGGVFAELRLDTLDDSRFPRTGQRARVRWDMSRQSLGADPNFETLEADYLSAWSRGKNTLQLGLRYATTYGADDVPHEYFPLGGFLNLSGLERGEVSGPHAALGRLIYYRLISDYAGGLFEVPVYFGGSVETGGVWQSRNDMSFTSALVNGSLFVAFDSYFGAIYIAAGFAEGGERTYYLSIGSPTR